MRWVEGLLREMMIDNQRRIYLMKIFLGVYDLVVEMVHVREMEMGTERELWDLDFF